MSENNRYDIFISYRREGGADFARNMQLKLQLSGYSVFLDYDELQNGVFNHKIFNAIEQAPVFMVVLSPHSLDRCNDKDDWVRREIEHALKCNRNIIPINLDRLFSRFPDDCPDFIRSMALSQYPIMSKAMLF